MNNVTLTPGETVYSKRCGGIGGFDGVIIEKRGNGYQVLDPKTGNIYQRDHYDLIALVQSSRSPSYRLQKLRQQQLQATEHQS